MPFGELPGAFVTQLLADDIVVHGWDLAQATGQKVVWDQQLASDLLRFMREPFSDPAMRGDDFGPAVDPPQDADAMTQLACYLGRTP